MGAPDPVTTGLATGFALATANQIAKQAQDFIAAVAGHKGESVGTILGSLVERRRKNAEAAAGGAYLTLLNIGVTPAEIPLKVLQPALDAASLEEDESMQQLWANLLANAADARHPGKILPSFPQILHQLRPSDAQFLNNLVDAWEANTTQQSRMLITLDMNNLHPVGMDDFSSERLKALWNPTQDTALSISNLEHCGLICRVYSTHKTEIGFHYEPTYLGGAFIEACRAPRIDA
jgi:hypothetical protein